MKMKHLIKRAAGLFLIIAFIATMNAGMAADSIQQMPEGFAEYSRIAEQQAQALEAYTVLRTTFTVNEDRSESYPDDYAGAWIDGSKLHIALTQDKRDASYRYNELLKAYGCVVFETAKYSLNELDKIRFAVFEELKDDFPIVTHHVDVKANKIYLGLLEVNEKSFFASIAKSDAAGKILSGKSVAEDLFVVGEEASSNLDADFVGGMALNAAYVGGPGPNLGVCGTFRYNGLIIPGFITSGHNLALSGDYQRLFLSGSQVGTVMLLQFQNYGVGDWAAVARVGTNYTESNKIYLSTSGNTIGYITGTIDDLPVGSVVSKYGAAYGYATATVTAQNASEAFGNITLNGLTKAVLRQGATGNGDSGGPYFVGTTSFNFNFVGVHTGSNVSNGGVIWFTPYVRFSHVFTVRTY